MVIPRRFPWGPLFILFVLLAGTFGYQLYRIQRTVRDTALQPNAPASVVPVPSAANLAALREGLRSSNPATRLGAINSAASLGAAAAPAVPELILLLNDRNITLRIKSAMALEKMGTEAAPATLTLGRIIEKSTPNDSPHADLRWLAAQALSSIGAPAAPAIPSLLKALKDPQPVVRAGAVAALSAIGKRDAVILRSLMHMEGDPEPIVRQHVLMALTKLDPGSKATLALLHRHVEDPNLKVAQQAEYLLGIKH